MMVVMMVKVAVMILKVVILVTGDNDGGDNVSNIFDDDHG
jgi:hypothetical protein